LVRYMPCHLLLIVFHDNKYIKFDLSAKVDTDIYLGSDNSNGFTVTSRELTEKHLLFKTRGASCTVRDLTGNGFVWRNRKMTEKTLEAGDMLGFGKTLALIAIRKSRYYDFFQKFEFGTVKTVNIGKSPGNNIVLPSMFVSGEHAAIIRDGGTLKLCDRKSKNGTFVNGAKVGECALRDGDEIFILGYRIKIRGNILEINNIGNGVVVNGLKTEISSSDTADLPAMTGSAPYPYFQRSPRICGQIAGGELEVSAPPQGASKPTISWLSVILPPLVMVASSVAMALMMRNTGWGYMVLMLSMTGVSVVISVVNYLSQIKKFKADEKKRVTAYRGYIEKLRNDLEERREQQKKLLNDHDPGLFECIRRVEYLDRRLWERTPADPDFLSLRLGKGSVPFETTIKIPREEFSLEEDPLKQEPEKLREQFRTVGDVPIRISLRDNNRIGVIGDRGKMIRMAQCLAVQIATHHSYDEVKIVCIFPAGEADAWEWMRWLPHTWDDGRQVRFIAREKMATHGIFSALAEVLKGRENARRQSCENSPSDALPHLVFFIADPGLVQNEQLMHFLINADSGLGISSLFFFNRLDKLPKSCDTLIEALPEGGAFYGRDSAGSKTHFDSDDGEPHEFEMFARRMAPVRGRELASAASIPKKVTFLEMFGAPSVQDLDALDRWKRAKPHRNLAVSIGRLAGHDNIALDIHEKAHGPHGLVAGTVGSGKSELLQSIILSLAVNFHPHDVNFVIIDYKGGGMANCFTGLPHVVGAITNLSSSEISRAMVSIKSEMKRRQTLFARYDLNSINGYIRLFKQRKAKIPLPHLIIVVDEFAELKADQPDFMRELVSAARLGRSLGLHLILATQKPAGVVDDQIWSNSRFKLCLKVQDDSDSREVLKRPDAANIQVTGRCFLQVGNDERFEQFQSAWSGAEYHAGGAAPKRGEVHVVNLDGSRRKEVTSATVFVPEKMTELKAVVNHLAETARHNNIQALDGPWLAPLPERLSLRELSGNGAGWDGNEWRSNPAWMCPVVGMADDPANQKQFPLGLDLGSEGHLAVYGAPGTGKTIFLQTVATSLVLAHSPHEVSLYVLDFGGRTMGLFADLPHVGGVVFPEDSEKLDKLMKFLLKEMEQRKRSFSDIGVSSIEAFRKVSDERISAMVVLIDNYSAMTELYQDVEEFLVPISREGGNYGIHLVMTANSTNAIRFRVSQNIRAAVALQMADRGDYLSIVGRTNGLEPGNSRGRGLIRSNPPLEFQTALPADAENEAAMAVAMRTIFKDMASQWHGRRAKPIPVMPETLTVTALLDCDEVRDLTTAGKKAVPFGLATEDMAPVWFDMEDTLCFLVSGTMGSGKTSFLRAVTRILHRQPPSENLQVYVVDSPEMSLASLATAFPLAGYISDSERFASLMRETVEELNIRKKDLNKQKRSGEAGVSESEYIAAKYPLKIILVDNLSQFIGMIDDPSKDSFERIVRHGKGLGVHIIISGNPDDIVRLYQIDPLTKLIVDLQTGLAFGGTFDQHNFFSTNMSYQDKGRQLVFGEGYFINRGRSIKTKIAVDG